MSGYQVDGGVWRHRRSRSLGSVGADPDEPLDPDATAAVQAVLASLSRP